MSERKFVALCLFAGGLSFVAVALDGHLYWHEGRLLYAVSHFSISQLISGEFNPNQLGATIDTASSSGYHLTKVFYLLALKGLVSLPIPTDGQLLLGSVISLLGLVSCGFMLRGILRNLRFSTGSANWAMVAFFLLPWTPYLAGKLLSEVTALVPATGALLLWSKCISNQSSKNALSMVGAGLLIAVTALGRLDVTIIHIGFAVATLVVAVGIDASRLLRLHVTVLGIAAAVYVLCIGTVEGAFGSILSYFRAYLSLHPKSALMSAFGMISFGGAMWLFAALAVRGPRTERNFLLVWAAVTLIPILAIVSNYMIEPRYLTASSVPVAGLAGIGIRMLIDSLNRSQKRFIVIGGLALLPAANGILVTLMPYEIDRDAILEVVDHYAPAGSDATLLASWSYTDFHFLRYARPGSRILNVCTPKSESLEITPEWDSRLREWYGWRYVPDYGALVQAIDRGPVYYVGWGVYPPIATMISWSEYLGLSGLRQELEALPLMTHRDQSWLWDSDLVEFDFQNSDSQYEIYLVQGRL